MNVETNQRKDIKAIFGKPLISMNVRSCTIIIALVGIWVILTILTKGKFLTPRNLAMLARQTAGVSILGLGMVLVIVAGHIDLSVGSVLGFCGAIAAILQVWYKWHTIPTILVTMALGILIGLWQGYWVAYKKVPAFIVTLGGAMIFRGMLLGVTKAVSISPMSESFKAIGQAYLSPSVGWFFTVSAIIINIYFVLKNRKSRMKYGFEVPSVSVTILKDLLVCALIVIFTVVMNGYQGIPIPVIILLVLTIIFEFIATKTKFGRSIYAIGGNIEASKLSGINIEKVTLFVFILMGWLCSIAGIILTARLNAATSNAGNMAELDTIAACVIGGTSLIGGIGSIPGAIIGALVMASLDNGMSLMNTENFWQYIIKGLILIVAVWVDISSKKKA